MSLIVKKNVILLCSVCIMAQKRVKNRKKQQKLNKQCV